MMKKKMSGNAHARLIAKMQSPHGMPNPIAPQNPIKAPKRMVPNVQAGSASVQPGVDSVGGT